LKSAPEAIPPRRLLSKWQRRYILFVKTITLDNPKITHMNKNTYQEPTAEVIQVMVEQTILEGSKHAATLDPWNEEPID